MKNSCMLSRNFSISEESRVKRAGKFSRRQRTALLEMLVPSRWISLRFLWSGV